jgi:hypothetical protein
MWCCCSAPCGRGDQRLQYRTPQHGGRGDVHGVQGRQRKSSAVQHRAATPRIKQGAAFPCFRRWSYSGLVAALKQRHSSFADRKGVALDELVLLPYAKRWR